MMTKKHLHTLADQEDVGELNRRRHEMGRIEQ